MEPRARSCRTTEVCKNLFLATSKLEHKKRSAQHCCRTSTGYIIECLVEVQEAAVHLIKLEACLLLLIYHKHIFYDAKVLC